VNGFFKISLSNACASKVTPKLSLFICFESHDQFFSYLATVTITSDRVVGLQINLDLCLAVRVLLRVTPTFAVFKIISERPVILPSECRALGEGAITTS
jgi:hypothetical protein